MALFALAASGFVLLVSFLLQWFIYDDWLHRTGPLRIVGTTLAAVLTFVFVHRWQCAARERQIDMLQRFETIARMNDVIRNALQIIEVTTYATDPATAQHVREAVTVIDGALEGMVAVTAPEAATAKKPPGPSALPILRSSAQAGKSGSP